MSFTKDVPFTQDESCHSHETWWWSTRHPGETHEDYLMAMFTQVHRSTLTCMLLCFLSIFAGTEFKIGMISNSQQQSQTIRMQPEPNWIYLN